MIFRKSRVPKIELNRKGIGERIGNARRSRMWTQRELADAIGASHGAVVSWERGQRIPRIQTLVAIAWALRRSLDWLVCNVSKRGTIHSTWKPMATDIPRETAADARLKDLCPGSAIAEPSAALENHSPSNPPLDGSDGGVGICCFPAPPNL